MLAMSNRSKTGKYGFSSAVTFFFVGLGIGTSSAFIYDLMPKSRAALARFKQWRSSASPTRSTTSQQRKERHDCPPRRLGQGFHDPGSLGWIAT
jgi:hypothetical protein